MDNSRFPSPAAERPTWEQGPNGSPRPSIPVPDYRQGGKSARERRSSRRRQPSRPEEQPHFSAPQQDRGKRWEHDGFQPHDMDPVAEDEHHRQQRSAGYESWEPTTGFSGPSHPQESGARSKSNRSKAPAAAAEMHRVHREQERPWAEQQRQTTPESGYRAHASGAGKDSLQEADPDMDQESVKASKYRDSKTGMSQQTQAGGEFPRGSNTSKSREQDKEGYGNPSNHRHRSPATPTRSRSPPADRTSHLSEPRKHAEQSAARNKSSSQYHQSHHSRPRSTNPPQRKCSRPSPQPAEQLRGEADAYYDPNQHFGGSRPPPLPTNQQQDQQPPIPSPVSIPPLNNAHSNGPPSPNPISIPPHPLKNFVSPLLRPSFHSDAPSKHRHFNHGPAPPHHPDLHHPPHSALQPGPLSTIKTLLDLARKKSHVANDTPQRLELLHRTDKFFNSGLVGKYAMLDRERAGRFAKEGRRVENVLRERRYGGAGMGEEGVGMREEGKGIEGEIGGGMEGRWRRSWN